MGNIVRWIIVGANAAMITYSNDYLVELLNILAIVLLSFSMGVRLGFESAPGKDVEDAQ